MEGAVLEPYGASIFRGQRAEEEPAKDTEKEEPARQGKNQDRSVTRSQEQEVF